MIFAVLFLIEAWLWDHLSAWIGSAVSLLPWDRLKALVRARIEHLSPVACLVVFILPVIIIFPLKITGVWLIGRHHVFLGICTFLFAKVAGLGVTAFLFESCKDKLLTLRWVNWLYHFMLGLRAWAHRQVEPARRYVQLVKKRLVGENGRFFVRLRRWRRRMNSHKNHYSL